MHTQFSPAIVAPLALLLVIALFIVSPWAAGIVLAIGVVVGVAAFILIAISRPAPGREHTDGSNDAVDPQTFASGRPASGEGN